MHMKFAWKWIAVLLLSASGVRAEGPACVQMCPHGSAVRISFKDMERVVSTLK